MKQSERIEQLERMVMDLDEQLKQLRNESALSDKRMDEISIQMGIQLSEHRTIKQEAKRQEDMRFAQEVRDALEVHHDHPFIESRDVFTTRHMHIIITGCVDPSLHKLKMDASRTGWHGPEFNKLNIELRSMTTRLVNSGLFMRRRTQRYVPVNPLDPNSKPSTTRATAILSGNFDRYKTMTDNAMGNEMARQFDRALHLYNANVKRMKEEQHKLDSEVTFL